MKKNLYALILLMLLMLFIVSCSQVETESHFVTIYFETEVDGLVVEEITGEPGKNITVPESPTREGYTFIGWLDEDGNPYRLTRFPSSSLTLYASWIMNGDQTTFRIDFLTNSSEYIEPIVLRAGDDIPELPTPSYFESNGLISTFDTWTYLGEEMKLDTMPAMDIVLTASWFTGEFAIYFNTTTEQVIQPIVNLPGEEIEPPEEGPSDGDHVFMGWFLNGKPYIFDTMPTESITLEAKWLNQTLTEYNEVTNLPKMFINLENSQSILSVTKETYVNSSVTMTNTTSENELFSVSSEFKGRGNGSWTSSGPKRGYRLKFFHKQSVFGEEKSKHWVLLAASNFYDPTLLKTKLAFDMTKEVFTNIEYASSTNWVELYINGAYRGVYILAEHIREDNDRVDIDSEFGVDDTGYLIEYDAYISNEGLLGVDYFTINGYRYGFGIKSPDPDDFLEEGISENRYKQQVAYIQNYTTEALSAALNAPHSDAAYQIFLEKADLASFVDMYILHELFKNADTGWSSFFMYKKPGGKLYAGPPWDFDSSAGKNRGDQSYTGIYVAGSVATESSHTASELYIALMKVDDFRQAVKERWSILSPEIETFINDYLTDSFIAENKEAIGKNYYYWSIYANTEGLIAEEQSAYIIYSSLENATNGWVNQVEILKHWLLNRNDWLDNEWRVS